MFFRGRPRRTPCAWARAVPAALLSRFRRGDWDALVHLIPEAFDPQLLSRIWVSREGMHYWRPSQPRPATPWEAEIDGIFEEAGRTVDDERRRELYRKFQEIAAEETPLIFTAQRVGLVAVSGRVRNFAPSPVGFLHDIARLEVID